MDNLSYIAFLCIFIALALMLPLMNGTSRGIIVFILVGQFCCLFASEANQRVLEAFSEDMFYVTTTITPCMEEVIKAMPILYFAIVVSDDRRRLILYSYALGVGFSLMENIIVLLQNIEHVTIIWALIRGFGASLVHGICTAAVGYGISYIWKKRKLFRCGIYGLLASAIIYHAMYNLLVQSNYLLAGVMLPILTYIPVTVLLRREIKRSRAGKKEEAAV